MFNREQFLAFVEANHQKIIKLNKEKGGDYAGDVDALSNFKDQAKDAGVTPEQTWLIFFGKHLAAIKTYVREGQVQSEPIEGRILDAILYLYLLLGLVDEKQHPVKHLPSMIKDGVTLPPPPPRAADNDYSSADPADQGLKATDFS